MRLIRRAPYLVTFGPDGSYLSLTINELGLKVVRRVACEPEDVLAYLCLQYGPESSRQFLKGESWRKNLSRSCYGNARSGSDFSEPPEEMRIHP